MSYPYHFTSLKIPPDPFMLLSYPPFIQFSIVEFKVPNDASSHAMVHSITNNTDVKQVSFSNPLHYSMTAKKTPTKKPALKSLAKQKQHQNSAFQDHDACKVPSLHHSTIENHSLQDYVSNITVMDVRDIVSLKKVFCKSFDTTPSALTLPPPSAACKM